MARDITIHPVLNGFVVQCGCQQLVARTIPELVDGIAEYYDNPEATERKYTKNAVNKINTALDTGIYQYKYPEFSLNTIGCLAPGTKVSS